MNNDAVSFSCERCSAELFAGKGDFYVIRIVAVADPSPPVFDDEDLGKDRRREMDALIENAADLTEQQLVDQVYRQLTICLCMRCYTPWIENPTSR